MNNLSHSLAFPVLVLVGSFAVPSLLAAPTPTAPAEGAVVPLVKAGQKAYLGLPQAVRRELLAKASERKKLTEVGYAPEKVTLAWKNAEGEVEVSLRRASDGLVVFATNAASLASVDIENLEIARTYAWTVKDKTGVATAHFKTEDYAPRFIHVDKIPNIRDLGGRIGMDGRRVKQGLVYRSAGLNDNASRLYLKTTELEAAAAKGGDALEKLLATTCDTSCRPTDVKRSAAKVRNYIKRDGHLPARYQKRYIVSSSVKPGKARLTDATRAYMTKVLGIRTDVDLRSAAECFGMTGSPLGPDVSWVRVPSSAYGGMAGEIGKKAFAKVFRVFLDAKNYPIDFHCIAGADRTGAVGFILNGLLGVAEDELYKDWETTGFHNRSVDFNHASRFDKLVAVFNKYPGGTVQARVEAYVKELGFTDADIAAFRAIMLEDRVSCATGK